MLAFVHMMKTAGQTVRSILRKNFGTSHCDFLINRGAREEDWLWAQKCYPQLDSIGGHSIMPRGDFDRLFSNVRYYTFLRDPIKRCLSHYQFLIAGGSAVDDFPDWIQTQSNYQCRFLCGEQHAEAAIEVLEQKVGFAGLVEHFDESLLLWRHWTGIENLDIGYKSVNVAKSNDLKQEILSQPRNRELLESCHEEDQKLYRYVLEEMYSSQIEAYPGSLKADLKAFEQQQKSASNWSWKGLLGQAKRNLKFRPGVRDWESELRESDRKVA